MSGRHRSSRGYRPVARIGLAAAAITLIVVASLFAVRHAPQAPASDTATTDPSTTLRTSFDALDLPVPVGVALVPVGGGEPLLLGDQQPEEAWSTMKVPLALAAERRNGENRAETRALVSSDNRSARQLVRSLGTPDQAAAALTAVLYEGHDPTVVTVPANGTWPHPGETVWSLTDSATWTAHLPCMPGSAHILDLMAHVGPTQQWGLAKIPGQRTAIKGGWGRSEADAGYVVRQIGLITLDDGAQVAVSLNAHAPKMTFNTGGAALNRVGRWLGANLPLLPGGHCPTR